MDKVEELKKQIEIILNGCNNSNIFDTIQCCENSFLNDCKTKEDINNYLDEYLFNLADAIDDLIKIQNELETIFYNNI